MYIARRRSREINFCCWSVNIADPNSVAAQDEFANLGDRGNTGVKGGNTQNVVQNQDGRLWVKYVLFVAKLRMSCKRNKRADCVFV